MDISVTGLLCSIGKNWGNGAVDDAVTKKNINTSFMFSALLAKLIFVEKYANRKMLQIVYDNVYT